MAMPELTVEQVNMLCEEVDELVVELERAYRTLALAQTIATAKAAINPTRDPITMRYAIEAWRRLPELDTLRDVEPALDMFLDLTATPAGLRVWQTVQLCCRRGLNIQQHEASRTALRTELARWRWYRQQRASVPDDQAAIGFLGLWCERQREGDHVGD